VYSMRRDMLGCHSLSNPVIPISAKLTGKNHHENGKLKAGCGKERPTGRANG